MKRFHFPLFLILVVCLGGAANAAREDHPVIVQLISARTGAALNIQAEAAITPKEVELGLMNRADVPEGTGMLFRFDPPRVVTFWMKNTLVPLDMLFIRADGQIAKIAARTTPLDLSPISSGEPVATVLEIRGGEAQRLQINVGDKAVFPGLTKDNAPALNLP